ncbi:MAG: hypothetical protein KKB51_21995 [Candidatus Riflebacteria bacterium]|nr:hypothetical protein [Candidatus Riflebacteria bacterium]
MSLVAPPGSMNTGVPKPANTPSVPASIRQEQAIPKCFGTDYFGKWSTSGMTFEAMRIDRPDYQTKCATCPLFERCYLTNHVRILRIKR